MNTLKESKIKKASKKKQLKTIKKCYNQLANAYMHLKVENEYLKKQIAILTDS